MRSRHRPKQERISAEVELSAWKVKDVAQAIVSTRKAAGMTQREVADAMQTTQSTIADMERGRSLPSTRTLQKFAEATNHAVQIRFVQRPAQTLSLNERRTMTDTRSRSGISPDRRQLLGGAMGLAGMLGFGNIRHVTAEEATAVALGIDDFVWTPPDWDNEPPLFTILDRRDSEVVVDSRMDGQINLPIAPQRIAVLDPSVYIALVELGLAERIVAVGTFGGDPLPRAGALSDEMVALHDDLPRFVSWEVDLEGLLVLEPDLVIGNNWVDDDVSALIRQFAPVIRIPLYATNNSSRALLRDFGALFDISETADQIISDFEVYAASAREAIASITLGKKLAKIRVDTNGNVVAYQSYLRNPGGGVYSPSLTAPFFRDLELTPSSFVELAGRLDEFESLISFSLEEIGLLDADYILFRASGDSSEPFDAFLSNPVVQHIHAAQQRQIYRYAEAELGYGLAGARAVIAWFVEQVTGEPFE